MSVHELSRVWRLDLPMSLKSPLLYLADCANQHTGLAFPKHKTTAKFVGCSVRTVRNAYAEAESRGWLVVVELGGGPGQATKYRFDLAAMERDATLSIGNHAQDAGYGVNPAPRSTNHAGGSTNHAPGADPPITPLKELTKSNHEEPALSSLSSPLIVKAEEEVLVNLNYAAGRKFRPTKENLKFIRGRLADYTREEVELVAQYAAAVWPNDDFMRNYVQPSTIFGGKFGNYLERAEEWDRRGRPANFEHSPGKNGKPKEGVVDKAVRRMHATREANPNQPALEVK